MKSMPYWAVLIVVVVLVVGYYLLSQQGRERRREKVGVDFAKTPGFHANQSYTDVRGEAAIGIDDRGRRIAVARKHTEPRTRVYSFSHLISAEVLRDETVVGAIGRAAQVAGTAGGGVGVQTGGGNGGARSEGSFSELFGSTAGRPGVTGLPRLAPVMGQTSQVALQVTFRNGEEEDVVLLRFYEGKPVNVDGVVGEKAFGEAKILLGSLDVAMKRAGSPPKGPAAPKTPVR
jgi:hypothetical protein